MKVVYIHHANRKKSFPPSQDDDITFLGEQDAKLTANLLFEANKKEKITKVYSSTFLRCSKTASLINEKLGLEIEFDERLNEHGSNAGESWLDTQTRLQEFIDEMVAKHNDNECVICVTSGINVAAFISKAYGLPPSKTAPMIGVPSCSPLIFEYKK
jgi:broad specificity phosphatase PhoE